MDGDSTHSVERINRCQTGGALGGSPCAVPWRLLFKSPTLHWSILFISYLTRPHSVLNRLHFGSFQTASYLVLIPSGTHLFVGGSLSHSIKSLLLNCICKGPFHSRITLVTGTKLQFCLGTSFHKCYVLAVCPLGWLQTHLVVNAGLELLIAAFIIPILG